MWLFFLRDIYLPNDTEVSFLIQCSRAYQRALRLVGVREPYVLHDFYTAFCACLAMLLSVLCRYAAAAAVCVLHCVGHLGTLVGGGRGHLEPAQLVLSLPPWCTGSVFL